MKKISLMLCALAGLFILSGCGDSPKDVAGKWGESVLAKNSAAGDVFLAPEMLAKGGTAGFIAALDAYDARILDPNLTPEMQKNLREEKGEAMEGLAKLWDGKQRKHGNTATVKKENVMVFLRKINGDWKIYNVNISPED